jgi:hypothetical protein
MERLGMERALKNKSVYWSKAPLLARSACLTVKNHQSYLTEAAHRKTKHLKTATAL